MKTIALGVIGYAVSLVGLAIAAVCWLGWAYIVWLMIGGPPVI